MGRRPRNIAAMPPPVPEASTVSDADRATEAYRAKGTHRLTNGPSNELILKHIRLTDQAANADAEAHSDHMAAIKAAEADGVDKKALKASRTMRKQDVIDVIAYFQRVLHYLALRDMPISQIELFPRIGDEGAKSVVEEITAEVAEDAADWDAEQEGYQAYHAGRNSDDHRHPPGSRAAQAWRRGWDKGDAEIEAEQQGRRTAHQSDDSDAE